MCPIAGYRSLTELELDWINRFKSEGEIIGKQIVELEKAGITDPRWVGIARTHLQQGLMAVTRAIAKPTTFA